MATGALTSRERTSSLIRRAIAVCDAGQAAVAEVARRSETQGRLYDDLRALVDREAGGRVPCILEASLGPAPEGAPDRPDRPVRPSDLVLTDIAPRVGAYWGDSCNTQTLEPPTEEQAAMLATVRDTLGPPRLTRDGREAYFSRRITEADVWIATLR